MPEHRNNIGFLRLALACAVIVGHAPEMIDGTTAREPIARLFGHGTLGGLAVTGFFLISGDLITASMVKLGRAGPYLERRVLRIVPGYVVAYLLGFALVGAVLSFDHADHLRRFVTNMLFLHDPPLMPDGIPQPFHSVNGAMWTISYEFRCYLLVCALWLVGALQNRRAMLSITGAMVVAAFAVTFEPVASLIDRPTRFRLFDLAIGAPSNDVLFGATFLVGSCVHLFRDRVMPLLDARMAAVGLALTAASLTIDHVAEIGKFVFGAAPLFWLAFEADLGRLRRINDRCDISYGTYLYGWPVATIFIALDPAIAPSTLIVLTLPAALALGAASWWLVERPTKDLARPLGVRPEAPMA